MHHRYDFSLILACYQEGEHFNDSIEKIIQVLDNTNYTYEIIFIDDASTDQTPELIKKIIKKYPRKNLSVFFHQKNQGRGKTVKQGFLKAKGKVMGYIDIDLEVPAEYIPHFIKAIKDGYHVANAHRIYDLYLQALPRWVASKGYRLLIKKILNTRLVDTEAGYKFFNRSKCFSLIKKCQYPGWFWDTEVMIRAERQGLKIIEIPVAFIRRTDKTSTVKLIPDTLKYLHNLWQFKRNFR